MPPLPEPDPYVVPREFHLGQHLEYPRKQNGRDSERQGEFDNVSEGLPPLWKEMGHAPTQDAANAVWNELKRVNPALDDVIAEFPVEANQPKNPEQTYVVKTGDTLSKISRQFYGNAADHMRIFNANRDKLQNPDQIEPGQELRIP